MLTGFGADAHPLKIAPFCSCCCCTSNPPNRVGHLATASTRLIQLRYQNITREGIPQRLPLRCGHCENLMEISQRLERAKQEVNLAVRKWLLAVCADIVVRGCVSEPGGRANGVEFMAD